MNKPIPFLCTEQSYDYRGADIGGLPHVAMNEEHISLYSQRLEAINRSLHERTVRRFLARWPEIRNYQEIGLITAALPSNKLALLSPLSDPLPSFDWRRGFSES
jgi:hypothetical protein